MKLRIGHGIRAKVNNQIVLAGNDRLLHRENIAHDVCNAGGTIVHSVVDNRYAGYILIAGELKEDAVQAIEKLIGESKKGDKIVFVGDGINDAPVLARVVQMSKCPNVQMSKCSNSQQLTVNNHSGATRIDIKYTF